MPLPSPRKIASSSTGPHLQVDLTDPPDLTDTLQRDKRRIVGHGSFGTVYSCLCTRNGEVAVKAITFPRRINQTEKDMFVRKMRRELGIWRRLDHPNIVPLLGTARGEDFASDHTCMVAMWMPNGTLFEYVNRDGIVLSLPSRIRLIQGTVSGLEYLHSKHIIHGDFHPGNILIDGEHNARLTDFGFSQSLGPAPDQLSYLWTDTILPGALAWTAPELMYPSLYPDLQLEATLSSDIYSLGSIILFILSGKIPWNRSEAESKLKEFQNPSRPPWPVNIPDVVWGFIEQCWSPRLPRNRPSAQEVLSFSKDKLKWSLQPKTNLESGINVVLFGTLGCGKSSIINLLAEEPIAQVSTDVDPCTKRPRWYQISIGKRRVRLWDTMGFRLAQGGDSSPLLPYEQAHAVLRNLPDGVDLILLCARKDGIFPSLGGLYWMINELFYGGRAPIAIVVTQFDTPDEGWWERNQDAIAQRTGIPARFIPHACVTTVRPGYQQSRQALKTLLEDYATTVAPISLCLDLSSYMTTALSLASHCGLSISEATALVEQFSKPLRPFNVVLFGEAGVGKSSVINLIAGDQLADVSAGIKTCTLYPRPYKINTGMQQFLIWDTMGFSGVSIEHGIGGAAIESAVRLIRDLSQRGGIDLLVFCKKCGRFSSSELGGYRLLEEFLCEGQVPVAVVVTHLELQNPMEKWWDANGANVVEALGRDVIGHACITSLAIEDSADARLHDKLSVSRLSIQTMLEDCVSSRSTLARVEGIQIKLSMKRTGEIGRAPRKMTVKNLMDRCGLTKAEAEELIKLYYGPGSV